MPGQRWDCDGVCTCFTFHVVVRVRSSRVLPRLTRKRCTSKPYTKCSEASSRIATPTLVRHPLQQNLCPCFRGVAVSLALSRPRVHAISDGVFTITLNRPKKYNAFDWSMYAEVQAALESAATNEDCVVAVLQGAGPFFSSTLLLPAAGCASAASHVASAGCQVVIYDSHVASGFGCGLPGGNDLANFANIPPEGPQKLAADAAVVLEGFVAAFIDFPKPLIAAVNGPAIGIAGRDNMRTVAGSYVCRDILFVRRVGFHSDHSGFVRHRVCQPQGNVQHSVFCAWTVSRGTRMSHCASAPVVCMYHPFACACCVCCDRCQACSSYLFPKIMGTAKANEVLLAGRKLTASEARDSGLVRTSTLPLQNAWLVFNG